MKKYLYEIFEVTEGLNSEETNVNVDSLAILSLMAVIRKETGTTINPSSLEPIQDTEISLDNLNTFLKDLKIGWN